MTTAACVDERDRQAVRDLLRRVGDKWSLVVVAELQQGPVRFTALLARIDGISHRLLTATLRDLERNGLVTRTVYAEVPPRVEYALTALGESLLEPLLALATWGEAHRQQVDDHRRDYDARQPRNVGVGLRRDRGAPAGAGSRRPARW